MDELILDEKHRYFLGKTRLPSVTQILSALGLTDFSAPWFTEAHREKGVLFHRCCELINTGGIDWDTVDLSVKPQVQAYAEWKQISGFKVEFSEKRMHSEDYGFAGTLDIAGYFPDDPHPVIIDLKRGASGPAVAYQLALYAILYSELPHPEKVFPSQVKRFSFEAFSGGNPKMIQHKDHMDIAVAKSILSVYQDGFNKKIYKLEV